MALVGDSAITAADQGNALRSPVQSSASDEIMRAKMQSMLARRRGRGRVLRAPVDATASPYGSAVDQGMAISRIGDLSDYPTRQPGGPRPMPPDYGGYQPPRRRR